MEAKEIAYQDIKQEQGPQKRSGVIRESGESNG